MKIIYAFAFFLVTALSSYAQNNIDLTLRYSIAQSRYEVYARPNFTQANFLWGSSQVSVVAPASVADAAFTVIPVAAGAWSDTSPTYAPGAAPSFDFHGIGSNGQATSLTANQELLLFTFTLPGNACVAGLRLFVNGSDPASDPINMPGDYTNVIYAGGSVSNFYSMNYANTGTTCVVCNLVAPTLSK